MIRQVVIRRHGGPEVLQLREVPVPEVGRGQVRIRVHTAGVAFADLLMREGLYPGAPRPPLVPGYDVAGVVEAVGDGVDSLRVGERVAAMTRFGGYAESIVLDAPLTVPVPDGVDDQQAVALVLNYLTAYQMLARIARVQEGERILVHGAAGGVGTALLELAALMNLAAWGTASAGKQATVQKYGATPIDYTAQDFADVIRRQTGDGVDAVFDAIGGAHWRRSYATLRPGGRLVAYGFSTAAPGGRRRLWRAVAGLLRSPRPHPLALMASSKGIFGYNSGNLRDQRRDWYRTDLAHLLRLCAEGRLRPVVSATFPLEQAGSAQRLLGAAKAIGKIVLVTRSADQASGSSSTHRS